MMTTNVWVKQVCNYKIKKKIRSSIQIKHVNVTLSFRNGMITNSAGTQKITKMSPPSVFLQRLSGGLTLSSTTSEDLRK